MATVSPARSSGGVGIDVITWSGLATGDTIVSDLPSATTSTVGSVQFTGTFGGATVVLQVSNNGSNWVTLKDVQGSDISATAAGMFEFSTAALYLRPFISGGTGDAVTATVVLRG